ncbi:AMP-binding protein [Sphingomonas sp.]|uniref:AMP-binding protein n=1 Tax=Sphingomonas sp. TaxID=28214 RepID=UPI002DD64E9A|nr:AMP-binding protein [Sphingomonas sp.]
MTDWNFGDLIDATARVVPAARPALIHGDRVIDWGTLDARTNRLARAMFDRGLPVDARVAIMARNVPEYIEIAVACVKARLTYVNINYRYTESEVEYVLADCQAAALFHQAEFTPVIGMLPDRLGGLAVMVDIDGDAYAAMTSEGDGSPLGIERSGDDGYFLYTGGTTGRPKGVRWRGRDARRVQMESPTIPRRAKTMDDHVDIVRNARAGRVIPACPLMHGAGLNSSMAELVAGGTVILLPSDRFDPVELWEQAARHKATRVLIVGDVFARPMARALEDNRGRWDLMSMRVISSAGLMWSEEVKAALVRELPQVTLVDVLGASEASGFGYAITTATSTTPTGLFDPGSETVLIEVDTDRVLGADEVGQGWLARRGPFAAGYHGDPVKTASVYREIGGVAYAIPGDLAAREPDGRLRLLGRDNMCVNTGGEKVFVEEVEEALKLAPGIDDVLVVGVPDATWGKSVAALVTTTGGFDESAIRAALGRTLAAYKIPKRLILLDALPRHASGKGDYRAATEIAVAHAAAPDRLSHM